MFKAGPGSFLLANDDLLQTPAFQSQAVNQTRGNSGLEAYTPYYKSSMALLLGLGPRGSMNISFDQLQMLPASLGTTHFLELWTRAGTIASICAAQR